MTRSGAHRENDGAGLVRLVADRDGLDRSVQRREGMTALDHDSKAVLEYAARVNQLEHEADRVHQDSIVELFDQEKDPIAVIKWKEIFDFLEAATDRCEDVGNLLEGVVVKHG